MRFPGNRVALPEAQDIPVVVEDEKHSSKNDAEAPAVSSNGLGAESDDDAIDLRAQKGVQKIEATTKVWSKASIIAAYIMCEPLPFCVVFHLIMLAC